MAWLTGWQYRKSHVINYATGAGTNYQVKVIAHYGSGTDSGADVYLNSKSRTDFGDIRFTDNDGTTLLDYWMESKTDSDNAVFWVEVADDLSTNPATIYIYYGKEDVTNASNGDATFLFYDHFLGTSLDLNKWVVRQGSVEVSNSELILTGTTSTRGLIDGLSSISINTALHTKVKGGGTTLKSHHFCSMRTSNNWSNRAGDIFGDPKENEFTYQTVKDGTTTSTSGIVLSSVTNYHIYKITWKTNESKFYQDNSLKVTHTTNVPEVDMVVVFYEGETNNQKCFVDWVFVRKYVDPEPSHGSWGSEEGIFISRLLSSRFGIIGIIQRLLSSLYSFLGFSITSVSTNIPRVIRTGENFVQLRCDWHDETDLSSSDYSCVFWVRDESNNIYGPYTGIITKEGPKEFNAIFDLDPNETFLLGNYDIKVEVTKYG